MQNVSVDIRLQANKEPGENATISNMATFLTTTTELNAHSKNCDIRANFLANLCRVHYAHSNI